MLTDGNTLWYAYSSHLLPLGRVNEQDINLVASWRIITSLKLFPRWSGSLPASPGELHKPPPTYQFYISLQSLTRTQWSGALWWEYSCHRSQQHQLWMVYEQWIQLGAAQSFVASLDPSCSPGVQGHYLSHQVWATNCHLSCLCHHKL